MVQSGYNILQGIQWVNVLFSTPRFPDVGLHAKLRSFLFPWISQARLLLGPVFYDALRAITPPMTGIKGNKTTHKAQQNQIPTTPRIANTFFPFLALFFA
jgi:hypothetical protein